MARYRQQLPEETVQHLKWKYEGLGKRQGLFTGIVRSNLLGTKVGYGYDPAYGDTPRFWHTIRNQVTAALADLQLLSNVADYSQIKEIFMETRHEELVKDPWKTDLAEVMIGLLRSHGDTEIIDSEDLLWRAELAEKIMDACMKFFKSHDLITSKAHKQAFEIFEDAVRSEISNLERNKIIVTKGKSGKPAGEWKWHPYGRDAIDTTKNPEDPRKVQKPRRKRGSSDLADAIAGTDDVKNPEPQRQELDRQAQEDLEQDRIAKEEKD
ncbi:MAG: hypothetical protein EX285_05150 [Thaumarchaeota archaeon]|nr:hypothetical protein [Nitrososphaerota archaeon]